MSHKQHNDVTLQLGYLEWTTFSQLKTLFMLGHIVMTIVIVVSTHHVKEKN